MISSAQIRTAIALLCGAIIAPGEVAAQGEARRVTSNRAITATARAGVEYDDNALRRTGEEVTSDFLTRYLASVDATLRRGDDLVLVTFGQGGKLFLRERGSDTLLTQLALGWRHRLTRRLNAGFTLDLKDRTERASMQDYNRGGASATAQAVLGRVTLDARAGWRYFSYKPNPSASSRGPAIGSNLSLALSPAWRAGVGYQWLSRGFDAPRLIDTGQGETPLPTIDPTTSRQDTYHAANASMNWRGPVLAELAYTYSLNTSNSYGQNLDRHNLRATITAPLLFEFFTSARLDLQRTSYEDPIFIDANFQIDEDNRNAAIISLGRPFGEGWETELRFSYYTQEIGAGDDYSRKTLMLGLGYTHEGTRDEPQ